MSEKLKHPCRYVPGIAAIMIVAAQLATLGCAQSTWAESTDVTTTEQGKNDPGSNPMPVAAQTRDHTSSPIFGVKIPDGYRKWELISVSAAPGKNELKAILGNGASIKAYRDGTVPFPDGSTLVKLTWKREPLAGFDGAFVTGGRHHGSGHGERLEEVRRNGRLGVRPIRRWQSRGRGSA